MKTPIAPLFLSLFLVAAPLQAEPLAEVGTVVVRPHAVAVGFAADAVVEAVNQATVAAQVAGRIVDMRVDAGQPVKKGELLARIDARDAAAAVAAARSQLATAEAGYARTKQLRAQNFVSQAAVDRARADYDAAHAAAAQAGVGLGHAAVTAPIAGVVALRHAEAGELATPGRPLLTIYAPAGLRVVASVPQYRLRDVQAAHSGKVAGKVAVKVEFPELGVSVDAAGFAVLPTADAATHVSQVRVALPPALAGVVPGMAARVRFVTGSAEKLTVPAAAVVRRGELTAVYVLAGDKPPSLRQLRLGETVGDGEIEVLAGLAADERVALDPVRAAVARQAGR